MTFAWDCTYGAAQPLKLLLHDVSNLESNSEVVFEENINNGSGAEPTSMMPWDSNMTFSLGEDPKRYDLSSEPDWVLDPSRVIAGGGRILGIGARIFEPLDDQNNCYTQGAPRVLSWLMR